MNRFIFGAMPYSHLLSDYLFKCLNIVLPPDIFIFIGLVVKLSNKSTKSIYHKKSLKGKLKPRTKM